MVNDGVAKTRITRAAAWLDIRSAIALLLILAVGLVTRLPLFQSRDAWLDELANYEMTLGGPLSGLPDRVRANDRFPPGFHYLSIFASEPKDMRFLSLFAGLACIPLARILGAKTFGSATGWMAAIIVAVSPSFVFFSREGRPFALGLFVLYAFLACIAELLRQPRKRVFACTLAVAIAVCMTQYAAIVVSCVSCSLAILLVASEVPRRWLAIKMLIAIQFVLCIAGAWMYFSYAAPQISTRGTGAGQFRDLFYDIFDPVTAVPFLADHNLQISQYAALGGVVGPRWAALAAMTIACGLAFAVRNLRDTSERWLVLSAAGSIVVFMILAGIGKHPYGGTRHCMILLPLLYTWFAAGVGRAKGRLSMLSIVAFIGLLGLMTIGLVRVNPAENRYQVSELIQQLATRESTNESLILTGSYDIPTFVHQITGDPFAGMRAFEESWEGNTIATSLHNFKHTLYLINLREVPLNGGQGRNLRITTAVGNRFWVVDSYRSEPPPQPFAAGSRFEAMEVLRAPGVRATRWQRFPTDNSHRSD